MKIETKRTYRHLRRRQRKQRQFQIVTYRVTTMTGAPKNKSDHGRMRCPTSLYRTRTKHSSPTGNRTLASRVTGGDTDHYIIKDISKRAAMQIYKHIESQYFSRIHCKNQSEPRCRFSVCPASAMVFSRPNTLCLTLMTVRFQ